MGKHTGASGSDTGSEEPEALDETRSIKSSLEALIEEGFEFDGVFAFTKQYSMRDAPNPCLSIDGIGTIGLPLSQREARVIVETCSQEIPAAQLRFENPDWEPWLTDVAGTSAYEALSLEGATFSLRKLALRAAEYPQLEAQNAESAGELVVVLPSRFEGGQHELRHRDQIKTFNVASQSGHSTTLVAAHAGVEHSISDVSSGYCLFLVYDIVQPLARAPASLPEMHEPVQRLRRILISWKADLDQGPEHLACVLRHKYERDPTFSAASLIGADELLLCHLSPLAAELGFSLHIAHLDTSSSATCGVSDYDSEKEYDDEAFVDHPDWVENWTEVKQVVDLKGMPVRVPGFKRKWSHENEWSHENQWGRVFLCGSSIEALLETEPDEVHLERTVEHSGSRSRMWRRAAIL
ncbi:hypothetical protein C8F01DRAFT_452522 [Mycena amicta]|nr:hypothetical protein C8F01DRAFT_452522 [Mycena amicta]